ncbi:molybdopterin-dependent oxidoreductase [Acinetobacter populi]|nr:molybdopterin-dependent oxidoreductase [Acinetobacter populi]
MKKIYLALCCVILPCFSPLTLAHAPTENIQQYISTELKIVGQVKQALTLDVNALSQYPQVIQNMQISKKNGEISELIQYQGVRLTDVLNAADIMTTHHNDVKKIIVIASAKDDYQVVFSWNELFNSPNGEGVIVIYQQDGHMLDDKTGRIALISSRDKLTGPRFVKWLDEIRVVQISN